MKKSEQQKKLKKLSLLRSVVLELTPDDLQQAAGGVKIKMGGSDGRGGSC